MSDEENNEEITPTVDSDLEADYELNEVENEPEGPEDQNIEEGEDSAKSEDKEAPVDWQGTQ